MALQINKNVLTFTFWLRPFFLFQEIMSNRQHFFCLFDGKSIKSTIVIAYYMENPDMENTDLY